MNFSRAVVLLLAVPALAQSWNSNAGGWNTGYGTVYGSFGLAMATQNIYTSTQQNMQRLMVRQAMINKWGLAAVEEAERNAKAGKQGKNTELQQQVVAAPPPPAPKNLGVFKPGKTTTFQKLGDAIGSTKEEKDAVALIGSATKDAFEAQPETKAWRNNVAGAFAFFLIGNLTIASGQEEPSDETSQALFQALNQALDANPEFAKTSAKQKQEMYELLIGFTGVPLAIYEDAKARNDAKQMKQAQEISTKLIELVFKTDASQVKLQ
jgi:hypothetical protein